MIAWCAGVALVTAFTACDPGMRCDGITASGRQVEPGVTVAADWRYHEPGSWVWIEGVGRRRIDDKGSAVVGRDRFDVFFSDRAEAIQFGRQRLRWHPAGSTTGPAARAVRLVIHRGGRRFSCSATLMADGAYTARHCTRGADLLLLDGRRVGAVTEDPIRDLAHIPGPGRAVPLRSPWPTEWATWRGASGASATLYWARRRWGGDTWCECEGGPVRGDSGSGVWGADGALLGIVTRVPRRDGAGRPVPSGSCPRGAVITVRVP